MKPRKKKLGLSSKDLLLMENIANRLGANLLCGLRPYRPTVVSLARDITRRLQRRLKTAKEDITPKKKPNLYNLDMVFIQDLNNLLRIFIAKDGLGEDYDKRLAQHLLAYLENIELKMPD